MYYLHWLLLSQFNFILSNMVSIYDNVCIMWQFMEITHTLYRLIFIKRMNVQNHLSPYKDKFLTTFFSSGEFHEPDIH